MKNLRNILVFFILLLLMLSSAVISTNKFALSTLKLTGVDEKYEFFKPVIHKLIKKGVDSAYIHQLLSDSSIYFNEKYVQLNVSLAKKDTSLQPDTNKILSQFANEFSTLQITKFVHENYEIFDRMEQRFSIPKIIVASLLWVETKFGNYLGNHYIANVYFNQALVDEPQFIDYNFKRLKNKYNLDKEESAELKKLLIVRSKSKANMALNELVTLYHLQNKLPYRTTEIKGSYAGAFGISQFLPSSYAKWAIDGNDDGKIDLYNIDDAIFSAANYLSKHGWGPDLHTQRKAVYAYNHSTAYVNTIFYLSERVQDYQAKLFFLPLKFQVLTF
ncbi:MAG TPA: lytic murein transglycosylase [Bacteroidota bacterium]|nr:lytic murein transglycosylase [Bacteroidota bacterium]